MSDRGKRPSSLVGVGHDTGDPSGEALVRAAADVVETFADRAVERNSPPSVIVLRGELERMSR
jgi:hypothetical protein